MFDLKPPRETAHEAMPALTEDAGAFRAACKCGWSDPRVLPTYGAAIFSSLRWHLDHIKVKDHYVSE